MGRSPFVKLALIALCAVSAAPKARAEPEEAVVIQRYLADLYLGDVMEDIHKIYPPAQEWPSYVQPKARVTRYRIESAFTKYPQRHVDTMWLGLKKGRLVEIQLIYDAKYTQTKSVEALAGDLALIYGEPKRTEGKFWWSDGRTVLRAFYAEVPVLKDGGKGVELRTSLQLMDADLFQRTD